jgi:hypothetical protein
LSSTETDCNRECLRAHTYMDDGDKDCPDNCPILNPIQKPAAVAPPDLTKANWIWTKEVIGAPNGILPGAARPFRKVIKTSAPSTV